MIIRLLSNKDKKHTINSEKEDINVEKILVNKQTKRPITSPLISNVINRYLKLNTNLFFLILYFCTLQ